MDVLSDAVAAMRTGVPHSNRTLARAPWRTHFPASGNSAGFHVVLQGSCWLLPDGGEPVHLQVGDVAFLPRSRGHALADSPGAANPGGEPGAETVLLCGAYALDSAREHPAVAELPDVIHLPARVGQYSPLRAAIDLLGHEVDTRDGSGAIAPLLEVLLLFLLRAWHEAHPADSGWVAALRDPAMYAALAAIHSEPGAPWTVGSLAARAGLSRSVFAQRFTATLGTGPLTYLTWWRMTCAAQLLRDTDELVRVVAERSGYTSEYAFAKAFKREFGVAPGRFRDQGRTAA
ncbi:AraC family transcriptional regulator [Nocardia sp. CDC153]|uniref:AraC family transcriptional regulator n=1 Tax=Nocardia sp. CDC153 TaxID=3112167 RepID=UPI002DBCC419|nr:AraC family transcriptional regulator [Nocardia sp. CDC153]MEC3956645.1 AraC family transcriptional regulator [Nocardia sp. CDC153]